MRVTNKNKPLKPKSKLEGIKLINIKIDDSEVKKTKVSKTSSEAINPMGIYYNKKEIRYDKIYPELPWNMNKTLVEFKLPLRLYNIKTNEVESKEQFIAKGIKSYATLSYVWGKTSLTESEQEEFKKYERWNQSLQPKSEFNSNLTPSGNKALLKAVEVCNLLEIEYLWMDKLCVNQADKKEKGQEVRKMRDYYDNSTVTLIAVQADMERELFDEWRKSFVDSSRGIDKKEFKKIMKEKKAAVATVQSSISVETTQSVISKQKADGSIELSETISKKLDVSSETLVTSVSTYAESEKVKKTNPSVWETALTLSYLKVNPSSHESTWKPQYEKAKKYLSTQISDEKLEVEILESSSKIVVEKVTKKKWYQRQNPTETNPEKAWEVFLSLHKITDPIQQQAWKESGFNPTWSAEGRKASQADEVWENNWKDLTINDPNGEIGQIKDWQKEEKNFTYASYDYETKNVNFLKHDKAEVDKVHKLLISIIQETDPTKLPSYHNLSLKANYDLVPDSINLATVQRIWGDKRWELFFATRNLTDEKQKNAWKSSGLTHQEAVTVYDNGWHDLTIDDPNNEKGQIKDWNKVDNKFTYSSYSIETQQVSLFQHNKKEIDKVHKLLIDIKQETDPTKLPMDNILESIANYSLVPHSVNIEFLRKVRDDKEQELWNPFFQTHGIEDKNIQKLWKSTNLNPSEAEITYNNGWIDLTINNQDNDVGKIFNLGNKSFDYSSWKQTTFQINPLIQTKTDLDANHWNMAWQKFFEPRNISDKTQQIAWKESGLTPFEEASTAYDQRNWHDLTIDSPHDEKGQIKEWSKENKTFTYTSYNHETKVVSILQHDKKQIDQVHKLLTDIALETDPTNLPTDEFLQGIASCQAIPAHILGTNPTGEKLEFNLTNLQKIRDDKEQELWNPFFQAHGIEDKTTQQLWKSTGLNIPEAERTFNNGWTDLAIDSPTDATGKISLNIKQKTFTYTSWQQTTPEVNPLTQPKSVLDTIHWIKVWTEFAEKRNIPLGEQRVAWRNSGLNPLKEAPLAYDKYHWCDLTVDSPDNEIGQIKNWNKNEKNFTYTSHNITTEEVKILEHSKIEVDKLHHLLRKIEQETEPTKLPNDEELKNATDYKLVPVSRNLETIKKIRDEKETLLWQPFFTTHNISEENQKNLWKKSGFNLTEAEMVWNNGWEDLSGLSIIDKQFDYILDNKKYHINPLIHDKREVDKAHEFFISFSKEIKNKDFIDLPSYEELTNNKYNEEKVPSKLSLSELKKIWNAKKIGVKPHNKFGKWVDGVSSSAPSLKVIDTIIDSEWFTRTWTFQEGLLPQQTIFMFDNLLVDGRALACFWDSYEDNYDSLSTIFSGTGEKIATPIGWTYHKEYNSRDFISLSLWETLNLVQNRQSTVPIDGIYSVLGLLPYGKSGQGEEVKVNYKSRFCLNCPDQQEASDCQHDEKNKNWPKYTKKDVEEALLEVIKNAVESGCGEPLAWFGSSNKSLGWLPKVNENGSVKVMGGIKVESSPDSVKFTSDGLEISGSEYLVKIDKSREISELLSLEEKVNWIFPSSHIYSTVRLMIESKPYVITKDKYNSFALNEIADGDVLIIPNEQEWTKVTVIYEEQKEDKSEQDFNQKKEVLTLAILATKGEGNIRYRKGLLLVNLLGKDIQQKFLLASEKKALEEKPNDLLVQITNQKNYLEQLKISAKDKLKSRISDIPLLGEIRTEKWQSRLEKLLTSQAKIIHGETIWEEKLVKVKQQLREKLTENEIEEFCQTIIKLNELQIKLVSLQEQKLENQVEISPK